MPTLSRAAVMLSLLLTTPTTAQPPPYPYPTPISHVIVNVHDPITPWTSNCHPATYNSHETFYIIQVGVPYDAGKGCLNVNNAVSEALGKDGPEGWMCRDDGFGDTLLVFLIDKGKKMRGKLEGAMEEMYPQVSGGFKC